MITRRRWIHGAALVLVAAPARAEDQDTALVQALRAGGVAVLLRHSRTVEGNGDPPGFRLEDCSTQRNLSADGRAQAQRIGAWFERQGIQPGIIRNSPWCRTRDTARLAFGRFEDWAALGNLFDDRTPERRNAAAVRDFVAALKPGRLAVLVTHGVSIAAFVGVHPAQGEAVVVRAERSAGSAPRLLVLGRIAAP